jgi:hypothetical protein
MVVKEAEMGRECSSRCENRRIYDFGGKPQGKSSLERSTGRYNANVKMGLR